MKLRQAVVPVTFLLLLICLGIGSLLLPDTKVSVSERRPLTQYKSYADQKAQANASGTAFGPANYFSYLEKYLPDQFPGRDFFRSIKAVFKKDVLFQKDNNGYYMVNGSLSRLDATLQEKAVQTSIDKLNQVYNDYFKGTDAKTYYALIPDKNVFLAKENGYLSYEFSEMQEAVRERLNSAVSEILIRDLLTIDDYYRTDSHWDQAKLPKIADALLAGMGSSYKVSEQSWIKNELAPFMGTYYGQAALPIEPDTLTYLTGPALDGVTVQNLMTGDACPVYDPEHFKNVDPYDVFLEGATPLLKLTNSNQPNGKQLVIFRDSFGSSISPLLATGYREMLIVDLRYISAGYLKQMVQFEKDCDVLFLFSNSVLNSYGVFAN